MNTETAPDAANSTVLPTGANITDSKDTPEVVELKKAVEKSKKNIAEAQNAGIKRGRGRPRKLKPGEASPSVAQPQSGEAIASASMPAPMPQTDLTPIMREGIKLPFAIMAGNLECEEIALTDEEAQTPAELANHLVNLYLPELHNQDPKKIIAWSFAAAVFMLVTKKTALYQAKKKESKAEATPDSAPQTNAELGDSAPVIPANGRAAAELFRRF